MPQTSTLYNRYPTDITHEQAPPPPSTYLFRGGRHRMWTRPEEGKKGRPTYASLTVLLRGLEVGQEVILDAPSSEALAGALAVLKATAREFGLHFRLDGGEVVTTSRVLNAAVSAREPWTEILTVRYRAYAILLARRTASDWLLPSDAPTNLV